MSSSEIPVVVSNPTSIFDLTLNNDRIRSFFEGGKAPAPIREFIYIHQYRPKQNFLVQIDVLIKMTEVYLIENPRKHGVGSKLERLAMEYAEALGPMDEERAAKLLGILSQLYQLCTRITKISHTQL